MKVQVFNDADQPQSAKMEVTEAQLEDLEAQLPTGWSIKEFS